MCGIFGYVGVPAPVDHVVLGALRAMEYRGYDSWGTAYISDDHQVGVAKGVGRVPHAGTIHRDASAAIGHTRWATHGEVSERNAHPHVSPDGRVAVVHNGIIENAEALRQTLGDSAWYASDTDSELMAHLVGVHLEQGFGLQKAVQDAFLLIEGTNAFVVLDFSTEEIVAITHRLPIRISCVADRVMLASDPAVFAGQATSILVLPDDVPVSLGLPGVKTASLLELERTGERVMVPDRCELPHTGPGSSMRAEIAEQPHVLRRLASSPGALDEAIASVARARRIVLTGCGSAFHAASFAADRLSYAAFGVDAVAIAASEMEERAPALGSEDVVIALTQSGETADVIDAVTLAAERGATTIGMVNVSGSSVARMVEIEVPLLAGTERSVLATKSFTAMLGRMVQFVDGLMSMTGHRPIGGAEDGLLIHAEALESTLSSAEVARWVEALQECLVDRSNALVVGAGAQMPIASEAALKIKEGTYVHAEAVRAGELKHGVIALIDNGFPCLLMSSGDAGASRQRIASAELRSRGAAVFELAARRAHELGDVRTQQRLTAKTPFEQTAIVQTVALETALARGIDPDYPRNLAKSVTVR